MPMSKFDFVMSWSMAFNAGPVQCHEKMLQITCVLVESQRRTLLMAQVKRTSKSKLRNKTVPVLGIAGLSLAVAGSGASASTTGSVADIQSKNTGARQVILGEKEIFADRFAAVSV